MLNVVMLSVIMLNVDMLNVIMLSVVMLSGVCIHFCASFQWYASSMLIFFICRDIPTEKSSNWLLDKSRGQCYKAFYGRKLRILVISSSVCPWQTFQPSLILQVKLEPTRVKLLSGAPFRCSTLGQRFDFTHKH